MGFFTIETKQTKLLDGIKLKNMDEVLENVAMFDLIPPFSIYDDKQSEKTADFMIFAKEKKYKFVDKKEVLKLVPKELKDFLKKKFQKPININGCSIKFVHPDDIKSIQGFYELWENKMIAIGSIVNTKDVIVINISNPEFPILIATDVTSEYKVKDFVKSVSDLCRN